MTNDNDTAPAHELRRAFGRARPAPLPSGYGTSLHEQLAFAVKLHPTHFWTLYLQDALNRIDELENIVLDNYTEPP